MNNAPIIDKITIAKTETTMLWLRQASAEVLRVCGTYQVHAFMADTRGFILSG